MDPLSQAVLGGSVPQTFFKKYSKYAFFIGAVAGLAPDIDYLIKSSTDPLFTIEYHRQITHSLFFIPFGSLIVAFLMFLLFKKRWPLKFKHYYVFSFLGYGTHGLLDGCTNYGTQLYWPFSTYRVSWNAISVLDPLATIPFTILVLIAFFKKKRVYSLIGLLYFLSYIGFGFVQKGRVEDIQNKLAHTRGHEIKRSLVKPTIFNNILWRSVYESNGRYYVDAVRVNWFGKTKVYEGESVSKEISLLGVSALHMYDYDRFSKFSSNYVFQYKDKVVGDIRYSLLPNEITPIWSIGFHDKPGHIDFITTRKPSPKKIERLKLMLRGEPLEREDI